MVCPACDIAKVDSSEAVNRSCVSAYRGSLWDDSGYLKEILGEGCRAVFVDDTKRAAIPVVGNALIAGLPGQSSVRCFRDGEERLESLLIKNPVRILS